MPAFAEKLAAAVYGTAIGDAMGAPVEGRPAAEILARFGSHDFTTFLPGRDPARGKGHGRITDDTLMTEALMRAYSAAGEHLDAYGYARYVLSEVRERKVWLPERQEEMPIFDRLYWPEKYPWLRLALAQAEPRSAGMGNMVNCGLAMFMLPVGAINAGDPAAAYQEAAALGAAHNESYALEAAAVLAACYAEAFGAGATAESVLAVACERARDGTQPAIAQALAAAEPGLPWEKVIAAIRAAVAPFDPRTSHAADDQPGAGAEPALSSGRPSRVHAIEELPVALGALRHGRGDFLATLRIAVCYGRDCDSIAGMAAGLCGALGGIEVIPSALHRAVDAANRRDFHALASGFAETVRAVHRRDGARVERRARSLTG